MFTALGAEKLVRLRLLLLVLLDNDFFVRSAPLLIAALGFLHKRCVRLRDWPVFTLYVSTINCGSQELEDAIAKQDYTPLQVQEMSTHCLSTLLSLLTVTRITIQV
jgi:hypothetical protein